MGQWGREEGEGERGRNERVYSGGNEEMREMDRTTDTYTREIGGLRESKMKKNVQSSSGNKTQKHPTTHTPLLLVVFYYFFCLLLFFYSSSSPLQSKY
jgi:hypothetical protein